MNRKIEAYDKIIELIKSGRRARYFYIVKRPLNTELPVCMCALGCLLSEDDLDYLSQYSLSTAVAFLQEVVLNKLYAYGFSLGELEYIQQINDKTKDDQIFIEYIESLKSKEVQ